MHFLIDPIKTVYRTADIFLNEVEIKTDGGFIPTLFSEPLPNITYTYNKEFREQTIFTSLDAASKVNIADFYFRKSQTKFTYDRFLGNLLTIISYLGGIWSTCYIVFSIIADNYSSYFFINSLSNKIYNYPSQLKRKKTVNYENQSISPSISPTKSREVKSIYNKIMEKIEIYLSYDRKLQLSFCGMWRIIIQNLFFFMKFNDEKYILMKKSEDNVMHDLDICNILKKLHEIDKIKTLLFSEEQQMMLGFSPKPEIFCSEADPSLFNRTSNGIKHLSKSMRLKRSKTKKKFLSEEINFDEIKPFKQLIFAWRNIKTSNQTSLNVNQNLLNMFGEHFSQIVDLSEEDMKIFCDQGKKVGSQLMNLAKAVQKAENGFKTFNGLIINEINPELSSHSENFINCGENTGELILGNSNRIEHISFTRSELEKDVKKEVKNKFIQIKGKLGLNYINNNEEEAKKLEIYKNNDPIIDCKTQRSKLFQDNFKEIHEKDQSKIKNFTVKDPILFTSTDRNLISQRDYLDSRRNQLNFKISTLDQEEGEENSIKRG